MPFRTSGSGLDRRRGFATTTPVFDAFDATPSLSRAGGSLGPRPRAPLPWEIALLWASASFADFCNQFDARTHPTSRRSSHASEAFAPLHAGIDGCRLRRPFRCVAAPGACEPHAAHAGFHRRAPLAWMSSLRAGALEERRARSLDDCASPSRAAPGHPGHRTDSPLGLDDPVAPRTGRDSPRAPPRERGRSLENQGAFHRDRTLTRARDCSLVRAWTVAPSRCLRGGMARGLPRLFCCRPPALF